MRRTLEKMAECGVPVFAELVSKIWPSLTKRSGDVLVGDSWNAHAALRAWARLRWLFATLETKATTWSASFQVRPRWRRAAARKPSSKNSVWFLWIAHHFSSWSRAGKGVGLTIRSQSSCNFSTACFDSVVFMSCCLSFALNFDWYRTSEA